MIKYLQIKINTGELKMKYKDWLNEWLEHYVKSTTKIRTYERYRELSVHIIKKVGEYSGILSPNMTLYGFIFIHVLSGIIVGRIMRHSESYS